MKKIVYSVLVAGSLGLSAVLAGEPVSWTRHLEGKVDVGLRVSHFQFREGAKTTYSADGTVAGGYTAGVSVNRLDEQQDYLPTLYANYHFTDYISLMLGWEYLEGRAWTLDKLDPHYDGDVEMSGPSIQLVARYPNESAFAPYGGFGFVFLNGDFKEEAGWSNGGAREMYADDARGTLLTLGCEYACNDVWSIDLMASMLQAESDASFALGGRVQRQTWNWPLDSYVYSIGAKYSF